MKHRFHLIAALAVIVNLGLGALCPAYADPIPVIDHGSQIGTIESTFYGEWYSFAVGAGKFPIGHGPTRVAGDTAGGARLDAVFTFTGCPENETLRPGVQFEWVQIVYTNSPVANVSRGLAPTTGYVDPWTPPGGNTGYEDSKPFYWTDAELANVGTGGGGLPNPLLFHDASRRAFTDAGITWRAELNLVCTWDSVVHPLGYYDWGWTMPADMLSDPTKSISLDPLVWHDGGSPGVNKLELPTEFGTLGWRITDESCCVPQIQGVPETGSSVILFVAVATMIFYGRRRRTTPATSAEPIAQQ